MLENDASSLTAPNLEMGKSFFRCHVQKWIKVREFDWINLIGIKKFSVFVASGCFMMGFEWFYVCWQSILGFLLKQLK